MIILIYNFLNLIDCYHLHFAYSANGVPYFFYQCFGRQFLDSIKLMIMCCFQKYQHLQILHFLPKRFQHYCFHTLLKVTITFEYQNYCQVIVIVNYFPQYFINFQIMTFLLYLMMILFELFHLLT